MELRQLRSLITLVENGFSVSRAADQLCLVQSAVSQHISRLEAEVGVRLFMRHGKRLVNLSEPGELIVKHAYRVLAETNAIVDIGKENTAPSTGTLNVGATHTQARYILPPIIKSFRKKFPAIELHIHQGTPEQLVNMAIKGSVDISICTEALGEYTELVSVPCYRWNRSVIAPIGHPILRLEELTLQTLCEYPMITYVFGFTGRGNFSDTFKKAKLSPDVILGAADTDIIKTYVREGLGIGVIASLAYCQNTDTDLVRRDLATLFPWETTKIAYHKDKFLRHYQQYFIDLFIEHVSKPDQWPGLKPC
ncbi:MAG: LysR family transcriptional regulator [Gammaproteobacteria bacterium]|nr:LysR family transcriptional regulator [Gammaproteobacteria bacterium]